jgi:aspartokinase-like uncharacterized kinase
MTWVVKIGGSLARDPSLPRWLALLGKRPGGIVVVPGGGGFVAQVRSAQAQWRFDDRVAHNMAVLGMVQYAMLLHALCATLTPADSESAVREVVGDGGVALWRPFDLLRRQADELTTWDVTSDSLAAWLARRLDAQCLALVKACAIPAGLSFQEYAQAGIVDRRFGEFVRHAAYRVELLGKGELTRMDELLQASRSARA